MKHLFIFDATRYSHSPQKLAQKILEKTFLSRGKYSITWKTHDTESDQRSFLTSPGWNIRDSMETAKA